ncbi:hypothetical protein HK096_011328, partial [Nowakowskiella sp. JEL0078]
MTSYPISSKSEADGSTSLIKRPLTSRTSRPETSTSRHSNPDNQLWKFGDNPDKDPMKFERNSHPLTREDIDRALSFFARSRQDRHNEKSDDKEGNERKDKYVKNKDEDKPLKALTKIGKDDVWYMIERFFPDINSSSGNKALKVIMSGKEDVTKDQLINMLVNKRISNPPFEDAFQ